MTSEHATRLTEATYRHESGRGQIWTIKIWDMAPVEVGAPARYTWQAAVGTQPVLLAKSTFTDPDAAVHDAVQQIWAKELDRR